MIYCIYCGETSVAELVGAGFFFTEARAENCRRLWLHAKKNNKHKKYLKLSKQPTKPFSYYQL